MTLAALQDGATTFLWTPSSVSLWNKIRTSHHYPRKTPRPCKVKPASRLVTANLMYEYSSRPTAELVLLSSAVHTGIDSKPSKSRQIAVQTTCNLRPIILPAQTRPPDTHRIIGSPHRPSTLSSLFREAFVMVGLVAPLLVKSNHSRNGLLCSTG